MNDETAIKWAGNLGATVIEYNQPPKVCQTLCALWIRRQAKDKSLFDGKRLWRPNPLDPRPLWQDTDQFKKKVGSLYGAIDKQLDFEREYIGGGKSANALRQHLGQSGRAPEKKPVGILFLGDQSYDFEEKAEGMFRIVRRIQRKKCLGSIGYFVDGGAHAIALDCSNSNFPAIFFDPLIGQFAFTTFENFTKWWWKCWYKRWEPDDLENAWQNIKWSKKIRCDFYIRPPEN